MPEFMPGLVLNQHYFTEVVRPLVAAAAPGLRYGAARLGSGSDVLGYDTALSTDHDWGPRLTLFLAAADLPRAPALAARLDQALPPMFRGYPTRFAPSTGGAPRPWIEITTVAAFGQARLGHAFAHPPSVADWLSFPMQRLLELTAGAVYQDDLGTLAALRTTLAWYPDDVWRYLLAASWSRFGQEEHLHARAGLAGDRLGGALLGGRLAHELMRLAFLQERRYAPYAKWFGSAFARLAAAAALTGWLETALTTSDWRERHPALLAAAEWLATRHNTLGLTAPLDPATRPFHDRPFAVIDGERFGPAFAAAVRDPAVAALFSRWPLGNVDQLSDNPNLLVWPARCQALAAVYAAPVASGDGEREGVIGGG